MVVTSLFLKNKHKCHRLIDSDAAVAGVGVAAPVSINVQVLGDSFHNYSLHALCGSLSESSCDD